MRRLNFTILHETKKKKKREKTTRNFPFQCTNLLDQRVVVRLETESMNDGFEGKVERAKTNKENQLVKDRRREKW